MRRVDLILLDIMMPGIDGYEVCKQLRLKTGKPIIFISALSQEENQLMAYQLGADDYVIKPFQPSHSLHAKVVAMIKTRSENKKNISLTVGHLQLRSYQSYFNYRSGQKITLAHKEYELLEYLCMHVNQLLTRQQILDHIWGYDYYGDGRAVDTYIKKLRKKLGEYACYIQTVIKTGYMLKVVERDEDNI